MTYLVSSGMKPGDTRKVQPAARARSACSSVMTVPVPSSISGTSAAMALMASSAAAVRKVTSAAMVLLESVIAFHRSEVVLLAVWFALLGAMVLEPGNRKLRVLALAIWGAAALALLLLHLLRLAAFQGGGLFVLIGLTLAGWTWHETGR